MADANSRYQTIKVRKGTVKDLRHLSFLMDKPMVDVVTFLANEELKKRGKSHESK